MSANSFFSSKAWPDGVVDIESFRHGEGPIVSGLDRSVDRLTDPGSTASLLADMAPFRVAGWTVYPLAGDIRAANKQVHLEPKVMDVLVELARRAGTIVTRAELLNKVWGARANLGDESLTRAISSLRKAFEDSPQDPKCIRTIHKRGYCFINADSTAAASVRSGDRAERSFV